MATVVHLSGQAPAKRQAPAKHRAPARYRIARALAASRRARGRRRRPSLLRRIGAWLGFELEAQRERQHFEAQLRELRLANAALRGEMSVLRFELEQAEALAAERSAEAVRSAMLLPLLYRLVAESAQRRARIHLDYSADVQQLAVAPAIIDLTDSAAETKPTEIVLPVRPAGAHRRTA